MIEKNIMGADNFVYGMREYLANKWGFFSSFHQKIVTIKYD